jgi:hypothetical protein
VRRGAPCTLGCHPAAVWSRRWGLLGSVLSAELSWLLIDQGGVWPMELVDGVPAVGVVAAAQECQGAGHAVRHRPASTIGCPPIRFPRPGSGRPAVRCLAVRCPVSWFRRPGSGRPVSARPASGRLVSARLVSARAPGSPSSRPRQPGGGLGDHVGAAGNLHDWDGSSCRWSAVSERLARPPESAWRGDGGETGGGAAADLAESGPAEAAAPLHR